MSEINNNDVVTPYEGVGDKTNIISVESPEKILVILFFERRFFMNLILKSLLFVVLFMVLIPTLVPAQTNLDTEKVIVIDDKEITVKTYQEYQIMSSIIQMVEVLQKAKSKGLPEQNYKDKVAVLLAHAEVMGIIIN